MSELDKIIDYIQSEDARRDVAKLKVKILIHEVFGDALKGETIKDMGEIFRQKVREL